MQYTAWDSEADAIEFFDAIADALPSLSANKTGRRDPTYLEHTTAGRTFAAERKGDTVVLLVGVPADKLADLRTQVWAGWKLKRN